MANSTIIHDITPSPTIIEPVLPVRSVGESVAYWHDILGFPGKWTWGDPPNHGGVSWGGASLQFILNPTQAKKSKGNSIWIGVKNLSEVYAMHLTKAKIVSQLEDKPWGATEYTVEEINGYFIHFSGSTGAKEIRAKDPLKSVRITTRKPTLAEVRTLMISVGWADATADDTPAQIQAIQSQIDHAVVIAVAENEKGEALGMAFLLGDNKHFYYIKDVVVHAKWQHNRIGTQLMNYLMQWLRTNARKPSTVGLFTGDHLAAFYKQFGFMQACGMYQQMI